MLAFGDDPAKEDSERSEKCENHHHANDESFGFATVFSKGILHRDTQRHSGRTLVEENSYCHDGCIRVLLVQAERQSLEDGVDAKTDHENEWRHLIETARRFFNCVILFLFGVCFLNQTFTLADHTL